MEYFGRCYEICSRLNNTSALYAARVQYGIAKGHQVMGNFSSSLTDLSDRGLQKLVKWKDARVAPAVVECGEEEEKEEEVEENEEGSGEERVKGDKDDSISVQQSSKDSAGGEGGEEDSTSVDEAIEHIHDGQDTANNNT